MGWVGEGMDVKTVLRIAADKNEQMRNHALC